MQADPTELKDVAGGKAQRHSDWPAIYYFFFAEDCRVFGLLDGGVLGLGEGAASTARSGTLRGAVPIVLNKAAFNG